MSLIPELHLALATLGLVLLAFEDWAYFEIAPQWVILAAVNIVAFQLSIGMPVSELVLGVLLMGAALALVVGALRALGRKNAIGLGDLYFIPIFGLATGHTYLQIGLAVLAITAVVFTLGFALMRGKRGWKIIKSMTPAAPPFAIAMIGILFFFYVRADAHQDSNLSIEWQTISAAFAYCGSVLAALLHIREVYFQRPRFGTHPDPVEKINNEK